jgi:WD40 repeat protein
MNVNGDLIRSIYSFCPPDKIAQGGLVCKKYHEVLNSAEMMDIIMNTQLKLPLSKKEKKWVLKHASLRILNLMIEKLSLHTDFHCLSRNSSKVCLPLILRPLLDRKAILQIVSTVKIKGEFSCILDNDLIGIAGNESVSILRYNSETKKTIECHKLKIEGLVYSRPCGIEKGLFSVGSSANCIYLIHYDSETGKMSKPIKFDTGGQVYHTPCPIGNNLLAVTSEDKCVSIIEYDKETGEMIECDKFEAGGDICSALCFNGKGVITFGSADQYVYLLHYDGETRKIGVCSKFKTGAEVLSSPCPLEEDLFVVGSHDKNVYLIQYDTKTGEMIECDRFETGGAVESSACALGNRFFTITSADDYVYLMRYDAKTRKMVECDKLKTGAGIPYVLGNELFLVRSDVTVDSVVTLIGYNEKTGQMTECDKLSLNGSSYDNYPCILSNGLIFMGSTDGVCNMFQIADGSLDEGESIKKLKATVKEIKMKAETLEEKLVLKDFEIERQAKEIEELKKRLNGSN